MTDTFAGCLGGRRHILVKVSKDQGDRTQNVDAKLPCPMPFREGEIGREDLLTGEKPWQGV